MEMVLAGDNGFAELLTGRATTSWVALTSENPWPKLHINNRVANRYMASP